MAFTPPFSHHLTLFLLYFCALHRWLWKESVRGCVLNHCWQQDRLTECITILELPQAVNCWVRTGRLSYFGTPLQSTWRHFSCDTIRNYVHIISLDCSALFSYHEDNHETLLHNNNCCVISKQWKWLDITYLLHGTLPLTLSVACLPAGWPSVAWCPSIRKEGRRNMWWLAKVCYLRGKYRNPLLTRKLNQVWCYFDDYDPAVRSVYCVYLLHFQRMKKKMRDVTGVLHLATPRH